MTLKLPLLPVLLAAAVGFSACSKKEEDKSPASPSETPKAVDNSGGANGNAGSNGNGGSNGNSGGTSTTGATFQRIIKSSSMSIVNGVTAHSHILLIGMSSDNSGSIKSVKVDGVDLKSSILKNAQIIEIGNVDQTITTKWKAALPKNNLEQDAKDLAGAPFVMIENFTLSSVKGKVVTIEVVITVGGKDNTVSGTMDYTSY